MSEFKLDIRDRSSRTLSPASGVLECEFVRALNRIPDARICIARDQVKDPEAALLAPGNQLTCTLSDQDQSQGTQFVFEGVIVRQKILTVGGVEAIEIELLDEAHRLTANRKTVVHQPDPSQPLVKDHELIGKLIADAKLKVGELQRTTPVPGALVQNHCSDWDFMVTRAEVHGLVLDVARGQVSLRDLSIRDAKGFPLNHGARTIHDLELTVDVRDLQPTVQRVGWDGDAGAGEPEKPRAVREPGVALGDLELKQLAPALGAEEQILYHGAQLTDVESGIWAESRLKRNRFALLQGRVVVDGDGSLVPLGHVELQGFAPPWSGNVVISAVTHRITQAGWQTELSLGMASEPFASRDDLADLPASGLLPPISNLHLATVAPGFKTDNSRVLVHLAAAGGEQKGVWARVARPDAGKHGGMVSWPEPGDEVVLGYLDGDPRYPVILGALHSADKPPPAKVSAPQAEERMITLTGRKGAEVTIDDRRNVIILQTPGGNRVVVDDKQKAISIQDEHGNALLLNSEGIVLNSASDLAIRAQGDVTISGRTVDVDA